MNPLKANPSALQDTVVALQALAKYAAATYSPQGTTTVRVTSLGGLNKVFTVKQDNRLLYQEEQLSEVPGEYTITAEGQSCVLTQVPPVPPPPLYYPSTLLLHIPQMLDGKTQTELLCVCVRVLQISLYYNIPPPDDFSAFTITTSTLAKCNAARPQLILLLYVRYCCRGWVVLIIFIPRFKL